MDTSFGTAMDEFIAEYIPENKQALATAQLQIIVIKAQRAFLEEVRTGIYDSHLSFFLPPTLVQTRTSGRRSKGQCNSGGWLQ
jgi:hypothetical protein